ncbi:MAG: Mur ligase family protein [Chthoniobacterales bacterium]
MPVSVQILLEKNPREVHLHFLGICGIAMGQMAIELQRLGYRVTGSDDQSDPPMSLMLAAAGIDVDSSGENRRNCDMLVIGRGHSLVDTGVSFVSLPELVSAFTQQAAQRVAVAGTKGKTTTTSMLTWMAHFAGLQPDYLIGGVPGNFPSGLHLNRSPLAILEGDEYASSPTDLTPKFVHYRPTAAVLTNIHPDHLELYPEFDSYEELFVSMLANLPNNGFAVVSGDASSNCIKAIAASSAPVTTVGWEETSTSRLTDYAADNDGTRFTFLGHAFHLSLLGKANVLDAALAIAAAHHLGIEPKISAKALRDFLPVQERLQHVGTPGGVRLFVDSNVHPASLQTAVEALRERHPTGRLLCLIQPQTPGPGDGYVQRTLPQALEQASHVLVAPPANQLEDCDPPFSCEQLIADLTSLNITSAYRATRKTLVAWVVENIHAGDTILIAVHAPSRALLVREITAAIEP